VRAAARNDPWERRHAQALADDVALAQRRITAAVLRRGNGAEPTRALQQLEKEHAREAGAYRALLQELRGEDCPLAAFALAVRLLQALAAAA
jgi:NAD-specific glutamate dehydrogenase